MLNVKQAQSIVGYSPGRPDTDFYPTHPSATRKLLEAERFDGSIWECACGRGDISEVLVDAGYDVYSSDLYNYGYGESGIDFLTTNDMVCTNIVTNPPFRLATQFLVHAINDLACNKLAMLCKLAFLEGKERSVILEQSPLKNVWVFRKRILLTRNGEPPRGSGMIAFAWFVWEKGYTDMPRIGWI